MRHVVHKMWCLSTTSFERRETFKISAAEKESSDKNQKLPDKETLRNLIALSGSSMLNVLFLECCHISLGSTLSPSL